jgi:hypothetical protein
VALPEVKVDIAFATLPTDAVQTWTNVASDSTGKQLEFTLKKGRQDELKEVDPGVMTTTLRNQDRAFDPAYTLGANYPNVVPIKQMRMQAIISAVTYDLMRGDIDEWPQTISGRTNTVSLQAWDAITALASVDLVLTRPVELISDRFTAVLDAAGWPAGDRVIATSQSSLQAVTEWTSDAASMLKELAFTEEDGYFFVDSVGRVVFHNRHKRLQTPYTTSNGTFSNQPAGGEYPLVECDYRQDKEFIKNVINLDQAGAVSQIVVEDATSKLQYRPRSLSLSTNNSNANEVQAKGEWYLGRLKDPVTRIRSITLEPQMDSTLWAQVLSREIGDRIRVKYYPPQSGTIQVIDKECHIEGIEHRYQVGRWTTTWKLSPAEINQYWILGDSVLSVLGSTTRLAY